MVKKIFAIIGIVLGGVAVFAGAVFGVLALMGRFRTPDVYPSSLMFMESEQTVVYRQDELDQLHTFVLNGFSNDENEVNHKTCYIYFYNNIGSKLITLCDENGVPLVAENNRYRIECNELVYYKLNENPTIDYEDENFGRVVLQARDERNQVQSNNLTLWIDRAVDNIALDYSSSSIVDNEQSVTIGMEVRMDFDYTATPNYSLRPMSSQEEKIVELYYQDPDQADYVLIDENSYQDYSFIHYDAETNEYYFMADSAGIYTFNIAVFATYQDRVNYLASADSQTDSNFERINHMVNRTLVVNVVNSDITSVGMDISGVNLNLYSNNNYITLNGTSGVENANDNNLRLYMLRDGRQTDIRFNEIDFTLDEEKYPTNWTKNNITFESVGGQTISINNSATNSITLSGFGTAFDGTYNFIHTNDQNQIQIPEISLEINYTLSNMYLGDKTVIESLSCNINVNEENIILTCSNGVVFLDTSNSTQDSTQKQFNLLRTGSYFEFYVLDSFDGSYTVCEDFDYEVTSFGTSNLKSWNIIAKSTPSLTDTETLMLGIMVVNSSGGYSFAAVNVVITPVDLSFTFVNEEDRTHNLNVTYPMVEDAFTINYPELNVDDIIRIDSGSYDACVFITPKLESGNYEVDVVEGMNFIDANGNEYVLVGYIDGKDYVNRVRVRQGATNAGCSIYILQLRNNYGQTAEDYINDIIDNNQIYYYYSFDIEENGETSTKYLSVRFTYDTESMSYVVAEMISTDGYTTGTVNPRLVNGNFVITINDQDITCNFEQLRYIDSSEIYLGNLQDNSATVVADVVRSFISNSQAVTINVSYELLPSEVDFNYNSVSQGGDDEHVVINGDRVEVVENTTDHTITLTSNVPDMLRNMYNTNGFGTDNVSVYLYSADGSLITDNSNSLTITSIMFSAESLVIHYDALSALTSSTNYLQIVITYNDVNIVSSPIYISSTAPTDIYFSYISGQAEDGGDIITVIDDLANNSTDAMTDDFYFRAVIGYDVLAGDYTYTYYVVNGNSTRQIYLADVFNSVSNNLTTSGFVVQPNIININQQVAYSTDAFTFGENIVPSVTMLGDYVIQITSGAVNKYVKIEFVNDGNFDLQQNSTVIRIDDEINYDLSSALSYTYTGAEIGVGANRVNISNVVPQFSGDRDLRVEYDLTNAENPAIYLVTDDDDAEVVLTISHKEIAGETPTWTFVRNSYLHTALTIDFDVNVLAYPSSSTLHFSIEFSSSIEINMNANWSNFYQNTQVLIYDILLNGATSNNEPIFEIVSNLPSSTNIQINYSINNGNSLPLETYELTLSQVGVYSFTFIAESGDNTSTLATYSITVIPNVVLDEVLTNEIYGGNSYTLDEIISLRSYRTDVVFGMYDDSSSVVPMYTDEYYDADATIDYSNVRVVSNSSDSMVSISEDNLVVSWLELIGSNVTETLTFNYNNNGSYIDLGSYEFTISNEYDDDVVNDANVDYYDSNTSTYELMANKDLENFLTIDGFNLTSIQLESETADIFSFEILSGNRFRIDENISNVYHNPLLRFTFMNTERQVLIYYTNNATYNIDVVPYLPDEAGDTIIYYSNNTYDLLKMFVDISSWDTANIQSLRITAVSDDNLFANTDFIGSGYTNDNNDNDYAYVTFSEIERTTTNVTITFTITYIDGIEYQFSREITINNRQSISINYPYQDFGSESTNFIFLDSEDGEVLGTPLSGGSAYTVNVENYEPVTMNQVLSFYHDDSLSITRAIVTNYHSDSAPTTDVGDFTISLAAYQSKENTINYYNNGFIEIDNESKSITFNYDANYGRSNYGYFIFKLTSTSGYVAYYNVYLFNQIGSDYSNIDYTNDYVAQDVKIEAEGMRYVEDVDGIDSVLGVEINNDFLSTNFGLTASGLSLDNIRFYLLESEYIYYRNSTATQEDNSTGSYSKQQEISEATLPNIYNYLYVKIGMVYRDNRTQFYFGSLSYYLTPYYTEQLRTDAGLTNRVANHNTGEYQKELFGLNEYENPFISIVAPSGDDTFSFSSANFRYNISTDNLTEGFSVDENAIYYGNDLDPIITLDNDGNLTIHKYVQTELDFVVSYEYLLTGLEDKGDEYYFVLKVYYSYDAVQVDTSVYNVTVGQFVNGEFNNRLELTSSIIGNYSKEIQIGNSAGNVTIDLSNPDASNGTRINDNVTFVYEDGRSYLEFEQTISEYVESLDITFLDISSQDQQTFVRRLNVNVRNGISYTQAQGTGSGYNFNNPYSATLNTSEASDFNPYIYSYGSTLPITINQENTQFSIGSGLTINTFENSKLHVSFSDPEYVVDFDSEYLSLDSTNNILRFVHTAQDTTIAMYITITPDDGSSYYLQNTGSSSTRLTLTFYIRIPKSYNGIIAKYNIVDAGHENVSSLSTIQDIYSHLFVNNDTATDIFDVYGGTQINYTRRVNIVGLNNQEYAVYNPVSMGFMDESNPNYIEFSLGDGITMAETSLDTGTVRHDLTFSRVDNNLMTQILMSNETGVSNTSYRFQIMSSQELTNGLDYQVDTVGTYGEQANTTEYVSITIDDPRQNAASTFRYGYTQDENSAWTAIGTNIANIMDGNNENFYITSVLVNRSQPSSVTKTVDVGNTGETIYVIDYSNYSLTLRVLNNRIYVALLRNGGTPVEQLTYRFTLYADSGLIVNNFEIVFFNYTLSSNYDTSYGNYYAGDFINLDNEITFTSNISSTNTNLVATLLTGNSGNVSRYSLGGNTVWIKDTTNNLFTYQEGSDTTNNMILTNAVASDATVNLVFEVSSGNYIVGYINFNFMLRVNFKFEVNGVEQVNNELRTNYILIIDKLDNGSTNRQFPLTDNLNTQELQTNTLLSVEVEDQYYTDLQLQLYSADGYDSLRDLDSVTISTDNTDVISINQETKSIVFNRDVAGEIVLTLSIDCEGNGIYTVTWYINVLGFVSLDYTSALGEMAIQRRSTGEGFASGTTVSPINSLSTTDGVGIVMSNTSGVNLSTSQPERPNNFTNPNVTAEYVVVPSTTSTTIDPVAAFAENSKTITEATVTFGLNDDSGLLANNRINVTLPNVPQSSGPNYTNYNVVYRFRLSYLEQVTEYYYVTYRVYNSASVTLNGTPSIDADRIIVNTGSTPSANIELFYYSIHYVYLENHTFDLIVTGDATKQVTLVQTIDDVETRFTRDSTNSSRYNATDGSGSYFMIATTPTGTRFTYYDDSTTIYDVADSGDNITVQTSYAGDEDNLPSIFTSSYNDIDSFLSFLQGINNIRLSNMTGFANNTNNEAYYELIDLGNGHYGINLLRPYASYDYSNNEFSEQITLTNNKLFNNELRADVDVMSNGKSIVHVDAYNGTSGFRLYTESALVANTVGSTGAITLSQIFLPSYMSTTALNYANVQIIGIISSGGTPNSTWVRYSNSGNNTGITVGSPQQRGTITVGNYTYTLYEYTYTGSGNSSTIYSLEQVFYVIATSDNSANIVTPYYSSGIQTYYFRVDYVEGSENSTLDLSTDKIRQYVMRDGEFIYEAVDSNFAVTYNNNNANISSEVVNISGGVISIATSTLIEYKIANPTATSVLLNFTTTCQGRTLTFNASFMLPYYYRVAYTAGSSSTLNVGYAITGNNNTNVTLNLTDTQYQDIVNISNGVVTILESNLIQYKNEHTDENETSLVLGFTATYSGNTITLTIEFVLPDTATE